MKKWLVLFLILIGIGASESVIKLDFSWIPNVRPYDYDKIGYAVTGKWHETRTDKTTGEQYPHQGIDYGLVYGTSVNATCDGKVKYAKCVDGYGLTIVIEGGKYIGDRWVPNGLEVYYAHLSEQMVLRGMDVKRGQVIAKTGCSWNVPPHLHYEIRYKGHDIFPYINQDKTNIELFKLLAR